MASLTGSLASNVTVYGTVAVHPLLVVGDNVTSKATSAMVPFTPVGSWLPLLIVSVCIVFMNGFLIVAFIRGKQQLLKASSGVLLCNQATSDLLNGVLFLPTIIAERLDRNSPVSPFVICYIFYLSLFSLCLLALDRFLSIVRPIHHRCYFRETSLFKFVGAVWILPLILALVPLFWWFKPVNERQGPSLGFFAFLWVVMFVFSVVMVVLYLITFKRVKDIIGNRQEEGESVLMRHGNGVTLTKRLAKKELRLTRLFSSLLFVFILSYIPVILVNLFHLAGKGHWVTSGLMEFSLYSFVSSSLINPLLCVWMQNKLRAQIVLLVKCEHHTQTPSRNSSSNFTIVAHKSKGPTDEHNHTETTA